MFNYLRIGDLFIYKKGHQSTEGNRYNENGTIVYNII